MENRVRISPRLLKSIRNKLIGLNHLNNSEAVDYVLADWIKTTEEREKHINQSAASDHFGPNLSLLSSFDPFYNNSESAC